MSTEPEILAGVPPESTSAASAPRRPQRWALHAFLFVATFFTAMWSQSVDFSEASLGDAVLGPLLEPHRLASGFVFAVTLMAILLAHEMGHYLTARRYGVDQSLPYFIPAPTLFGTLGAVILMRSQPPDRRVLLRVAVAGPFAGVLLAIPAAAWGLTHSAPIEPALGAGEYWFGSSLLFTWLERWFAPDGNGLYQAHPVALAAWVGLFVTSINLIPAAQLDGGHIAYALFGTRQLRLSRAFVVALLVIGIYYGPGDRGSIWLIWAGLLAVVGLRHPPVRHEWVPLSRAERASGYVALALFVLTFIPVPIDHNTVALEKPSDSKPQLEGTEGRGPAEEFRL